MQAVGGMVPQMLLCTQGTESADPGPLSLTSMAHTSFCPVPAGFLKHHSSTHKSFQHVSPGASPSCLPTCSLEARAAREWSGEEKTLAGSPKPLALKCLDPLSVYS